MIKNCICFRGDKSFSLHAALLYGKTDLQEFQAKWRVWKQVEAGALALILNVHNGAVSLAGQLRHIGLRPAFSSLACFKASPSHEHQTFFRLGSFSYHFISLYIRIQL